MRRLTMLNAGEETILSATKPFCGVGAKILKPTPRTHHADDARSAHQLMGGTHQ
jgi:hypothetical protein